MTEHCRRCAYRTYITSSISICEYCNIEREPRGCEPKDCKKMGRYKTGRVKKKKSPYEVTVLWEQKSSIGVK